MNRKNLKSKFALFSCIMIPTFAYSGDLSQGAALAFQASKGPNTVAMPDCRSGHVQPDDKDVALVVRVVVPQGFNPNAVTRNVRYQTPTADELKEDEYDNGKPNYYQGDPNALYPFHVDLTEISTGKRYASIRVVLRDPANYTFYDEKGTARKRGIHGVGYSPPNSSPYNPLGFCGAHLETGKFVAAVFYVKMKDKSNKKDLGSFNFGLVPVKPNDTPIFVDPKVINNG